VVSSAWKINADALASGCQWGCLAGFLLCSGFIFISVSVMGRNVKLLGGNEKKLAIKTERAYIIVILRKG
jgi:hypothetical protein